MRTLGVLFTRGVSLSKWVEAGIYDREVAIYRRHLENGIFTRVMWFTYGENDRREAKALTRHGRLPSGLMVVPAPRWLRYFGRAGSIMYSLVLPLVKVRELSQCDVLKTNQMEGALAAVIAALIFRRPLYVRTGYTLSRVVDTLFPRNVIRRGAAWLTEFLAFRFGNKSSVSSRFDFLHVMHRYGLKDCPPEVVGNFVDTDMFIPHDIQRKERIVFVGRLSAEKNLNAAILACATKNIGLDIVGQGDEYTTLQKIVSSCNADVRWIGVVPNDALPALLNVYRYFILPSLWEGMPKALLEAMSMGLICIGNATTGITEIIEDGKTGFLSSDSSAGALAKAIQRARCADHDAIGKAARQFVLEHYSLTAIAAQEAAILLSLLTNKAYRSRGVYEQP